jgi:hypothetical protein
MGQTKIGPDKKGSVGLMNGQDENRPLNYLSRTENQGEIDSVLIMCLLSRMENQGDIDLV